MRKYFSQEFLEDICYNSKYVENQHQYMSRWAEHRTMIFEHEGRFWSVCYERPATEMQDGAPAPFSTAHQQEALEMEPYEVTVTRYKQVQDYQNGK